ncbi:hypothetical protein OHB24_10975 [Kribbella sp. NBC_00482]|uniref:hypothetical protein n=1 Tax=Kribbella sp. NBC_00482 TaxID=2975968 RepID=UPI002E175DA4
MAEHPDHQAYDRARELLAQYHNEDLPADFARHTPDAFKAFQVTPYEEWLIFTADGFGNQTFLVSDPMVYESPGWQSYEDALTEARALKAAGATRRPQEDSEPGGTRLNPLRLLRGVRGGDRRRRFRVRREGN